MRKKSLLALLAFATFAAAVVVGMGATAAVAGEVSGNCGTATDPAPFKGSDTAADNCKDDYSQGNSVCKFSGQNDHPDGSASGPGGRTQSYGQDVKSGFSDTAQTQPIDPSTQNPGKTDTPTAFPGYQCNGSG